MNAALPPHPSSDITNQLVWWGGLQLSEFKTVLQRVRELPRVSGYSPWGCKESNTTERLHFHFSLSRTGEGIGNPLQCSYLENPRDRGAWWAAVYGVA